MIPWLTEQLYFMAIPPLSTSLEDRMTEEQSQSQESFPEKRGYGRLKLLLAFVVALGAVSIMVNIAFSPPPQPGGGGGDAAPFVPPPPPVIEVDGYTLLKDEGNAYYDVTDADVDPEDLFGNTGRSTTSSFQNPTFTTVEAARLKLTPGNYVIVVKIDDEARIYPLEYISYQPVINDTVDGTPILIYQTGTDRLFGGVYDRRLGENVHTYALSSHRIKKPDVDNNNETWMLWDVETESLWWPLIGKAVSGQMRGTPMRVLDTDLWCVISWDDAAENYPDAQVMAPELTDYVRPVRSKMDATETTFVAHDAEDAWPALSAEGVPEAEMIQPLWGSNSTLP